MHTQTHIKTLPRPCNNNLRRKSFWNYAENNMLLWYGVCVCLGCSKQHCCSMNMRNKRVTREQTDLKEWEHDDMKTRLLRREYEWWVEQVKEAERERERVKSEMMMKTLWTPNWVSCYVANVANIICCAYSESEMLKKKEDQQRK